MSQYAHDIVRDLGNMYCPCSLCGSSDLFTLCSGTKMHLIDLLMR